MARSRKRQPFYSCRVGSLKSWKQVTNRAFRSRCRQIINTCLDWDELVIPLINEVDTIWSSPKDSYKCYRGQKKPYEDECFRHQQKWYCWGWSKDRWTEMFKAKNGHKKNCECLSNKNNYYWKAFRK